MSGEASAPALFLLFAQALASAVFSLPVIVNLACLVRSCQSSIVGPVASLSASPGCSSSPQHKPLFSGRNSVSLRQDQATLQAVSGGFQTRSRVEPGRPIAARTASLANEAACRACCTPCERALGRQIRAQVAIRCIARRHGPGGFWGLESVMGIVLWRSGLYRAGLLPSTLEPPHVVQQHSAGWCCVYKAA
ncbi:hypothetical protein BD289DRAFT_62096 [Coniella lustricola]|uniref:Secreted protein n=1 Tax=Coniella lustricola TaxID=2025994 RepID=A0A2T3A0H1_9PEZI|nr:hypothetical protein BD289DRAFT_62096 [Coniella lustricola]